MNSSRGFQQKALFSAGGLGLFLLLLPLIGFFVHPIVGIILLIGAIWGTYKFYFFCLRNFAEVEVNERRGYVQRRKSLAKLEMDLFDDPLCEVNDEDQLQRHLDTCICKACR